MVILVAAALSTGQRLKYIKALTVKNIQETSSYLNKYADESTSTINFSHEDACQNNLLLDWIIRVNDEQQAIHNFLTVADSTKKSLALLRNQILNPRITINRNGAFNFRPILVATAMIMESASKARGTVEQVQSEEKEWLQLAADRGIGV